MEERAYTSFVTRSGSRDGILLGCVKIHIWQLNAFPHDRLEFESKNLKGRLIAYRTET